MSEREFLIWDADEYTAPDDPDYDEDDAVAAAWEWKAASCIGAEDAALAYAKRHYSEDYPDSFSLVVQDTGTGEVTRWTVGIVDEPAFYTTRTP